MNNIATIISHKIKQMYIFIMLKLIVDCSEDYETLL